jgi:hypothetical protein
MQPIDLEDGRRGKPMSALVGSKQGGPSGLPLCPCCFSYDLESVASNPAFSYLQMTCPSCHFSVRVFLGADTLPNEYASLSADSAFPND